MDPACILGRVVVRPSQSMGYGGIICPTDAKTK